LIRSFRHRGLKSLWEGDPRRVSGALRERLENILAVLDAAKSSRDVDLPGYRLHALKGDLKGLWSVTVSGNWRVTFRIEAGSVLDVDLTDYH
jgi:toxin HigB-1